MSQQSNGLLLELKWAHDASRERVFGMLTQPIELAKWWGPRGFSTSVPEFDLTVGGAYRFTMTPPGGGPFHLSGEFLEIDSPSRLAFTFRWDEPTPDDRETIVRLFLGAQGDATELSLSQGLFATEERLELHRSGWTDSFAKLRDVLESAS